MGVGVAEGEGVRVGVGVCVGVEVGGGVDVAVGVVVGGAVGLALQVAVAEGMRVAVRDGVGVAPGALSSSPPQPVSVERSSRTSEIRAAKRCAPCQCELAHPLGEGQVARLPVRTFLRSARVCPAGLGRKADHRTRTAKYVVPTRNHSDPAVSIRVFWLSAFSSQPSAGGHPRQRFSLADG